MAATTFQDMIAGERTRLNGLMEDISNRQQKLNEELSVVRRELAAVDAYEAAKNGKGTRSASTGGRGPRGAKQETLLSLLGGFPKGMSRGEILENLGLKGNKAGEQSISNALNNMKKAGRVVSKDGKYIVA